MTDPLKEFADSLTPREKETYRILAEKALIPKKPLEAVKRGKMWIKTKAATIEPLRLNKAQLKLVETIERLMEEGKPVRILILKARQMGMSTVVEAIIYALTAYQENNNSLIVAHDADSAGNIFEMSKLFQEKMEKHLCQPTKKSNAKELVFDKIHSQIVIDTANNAGAGRSFTFRLVHLSEYAFYKNHEMLMAGLNQTIPNLPGTMIIKETTANGFNFFRDEWNDAEEGKNDYIPVFLPWFYDEGYMTRLSSNESMALDSDELILRDRMTKQGITCINDRISWRRWAIPNLCRNSVEVFNQEYPSTPHEAFMASGKCMFDKKMLIKRLDTLKRAKQQETFYEKSAHIVESNNGFELRYADDGPFTFFAEPDSSGSYSGDFTVSGDASSGAAVDYSVIEARRKQDNFQICTFRGKVSPDELERLSYLLGSFLNNAVVAIENDKFGFAVNQQLKKRYGYVYLQERIETDGAVTTKYGWDTNSNTRPAMLAALEEDIRQDALQINDVQFVNECLSFIYNEDKKRVEAEDGTNDDCVMAMAINCMMRKLHPYQPKRDSKAGIFIPDRPRNLGYGWKK